MISISFNINKILILPHLNPRIIYTMINQTIYFQTAEVKVHRKLNVFLTWIFLFWLINGLMMMMMMMMMIFFTGLWTFLWFVGFCYMADAWRRSDVNDHSYYAPSGYGKDNIRAAIAFSFFSILSWVGFCGWVLYNIQCRIIP